MRGIKGAEWGPSRDASSLCDTAGLLRTVSSPRGRTLVSPRSLQKEDPMNQRARMVFDGAVAGIIGAFVIALWYLIFDAARGQPVGSLGSVAVTLFGGTQRGGALILGRLGFPFSVFALLGQFQCL